MNYRAIFYGFNEPGNDTCIKYQLDLIKEPSSLTYTEIELAGESPCVLTYDESETPFDPVRTSQLTISVVADTYLEDILPTCPKDIKVQLKNATTSKVLFTGWLRPFVLSADYRDCYENFQLYADDCLGILKYYPFQTKVSGVTSIVSFRDILAQICDIGESIKGFYWPRTKYSGTTAQSIMMPTNYGISEKNFYYDDVDETLKLNEVLEEMAKYVGFTAIQQGEYLYMFDYQRLSNNANEYMTLFQKSNSYAVGGNSYQGSTIALNQSYVVGSSPQVTIEPLKNKIEVRDNYYNVDEIIPAPFDDDLLTNRFGGENNFNYAVQIPDAFSAGTRDTERAWWYSGIWKKWEKVGDTAYTYYHRVYDHDYWESVYNGSSTATANTNYSGSTVGGTIVEHGYAKNDYDSDYGQRIIASSVNYKRYLMINQQNTGQARLPLELIPVSLTQSQWYPLTAPMDYPVFRLKSGYTVDFVLPSDSYLVIDGSIMFEKYTECPYINPDWSQSAPRVSQLPFTPGGMEAFGYMAFKLGIGGKWWDGTGWTTTERGFWVAPEKTQKTHPAYNIESKVLNNVRWDDYIGADGYKIPLSGLTFSGPITFEVLLPSIQFITGNEKKYNAFAWLSDLSFRVYRKGESEADNGSENDFIISNVVTGCGVMEMSEINLKITTAGEKSKASWSDCVLMSGTSNTLLSQVREPSISGNTAQSPEWNIVQKYVDQYSKQTKKISITLPVSITQFTRLENLDVDNPNDKYVILGSEIDYHNGEQRITAIKKN
ncbi:MAG: hypothetical protein J6U51_07100 [Bacteroidales bacterium]|nr:hypothetical protein [Bacteroidales bacterium]